MCTSSTVRKAGWVSKEGKRFKGKNRRYLVLQGSTLCHHTKENTPATWQVEVTDARLSFGERPLQFVITTEDRAAAFFADTHDELLEWCYAFKYVSAILEDFYALGRQLGKGSYGEVFLATDKLSANQFAIKIIKKNGNRKQKKFIERERTILTTVQHPNIVRTFEVFDGPVKLAIVSEYMEGGELFDLIIASQYFTEDVSYVSISGLLLLFLSFLAYQQPSPHPSNCFSNPWFCDCVMSHRKHATSCVKF